jgi:carbon-monoxide dehydrogenase medium subunit
LSPLPEITLHRPKNLSEALDLMVDLEDVKPIAGGTDLLPQLREGEIQTSNLVDLQYVHGLRGIRVKNDFIRIGALVTLTELLKSSIVAEKAPILNEAAIKVGSVQTRNLGTLVGNICNASPAADMAPALMVLNSRAIIKSAKDSRRIKVHEIFRGAKKNALGKNEVVTEILIPIPPPNHGSSFKKLGRRRGTTLALVNAAAYLELEQSVCKRARFALGAVAPTPIRILKVEEMLEGKELTPKLLAESSKVCYNLVQPVDDIRTSAMYRKEMSCVLLKRAMMGALSQEENHYDS